jgi:glyoxylase-like metal-dependent hydrolase (beta-lactamase superfamily II)
MMRAIGMVRIHHLNCATFCPPFGATLNEPGIFVTHVLAIETSDGLILVDTGVGSRDLEAPRRRLGLTFLLAFQPVLQTSETAVEQLRRLGYKASDVRHVVLTHLDPDHAGGLADFPDAKIHVLARERQLAQSKLPLRHSWRYRPMQLAHSPHWVDYTVDGARWFGFEAVRALEGIREEILLVPLSGHTLGHCGVALRDGERWLLHAGDAYYHHHELSGGRAPWLLERTERTLAMDDKARRLNRHRLVELAQLGTVKIFCSHDPVEWQALAVPSR